MPLGAFKAALMGTAGADAGADVVLLSTQTADSSTVLDFTGMDSTYGEYIFKFYNINPEVSGGVYTNTANFQFSMGIPAISNGQMVHTSAVFIAIQAENATQENLAYSTHMDLQQSETPQPLAHNIGNGADESCAGELHIFNPASTTYVKHYQGLTSMYDEGNTTAGRAGVHYTAGYHNRAGAVTEVRFSMTTGDWDGKIKMWGVK
jgi:hypothetical protein